MADKKRTEELNEQELDQVTGGAVDSHDAFANLEVSHLKPGLTGKTGIRVGKRAGSVGIRATKVINSEVGKGEI